MFHIIGGTTPTITWNYLDGNLMSDLSNAIGQVGEWFESNPLLAMCLTVGVVGLAIKLIRSLRGAIL